VLARNRKGEVVNLRIAIVLFAVLTVGTLSVGSVLGQGGTGREPTPSLPKKATTKKPPPKQTSTKPGNSPSSFHPQNPHIELVRIPPGSFMMGSTNGEADEKPVHQVTMNYSFYMGKYEVTQAQWLALMGDNPSEFKGCGNCPVEHVSWDDAQRFIQRLNGMYDGYTYRLPSEAEWEYACRAGTTGDYAGTLDAMAWYGNNSGRHYLDATEVWRADKSNYVKRLEDNGNHTHPVGMKQPNAYGLCDMHGNVWEWCQDWYHDSYDGAPTDATAWLSGGVQKERINRGGSWISPANGYLRSAGRTHVAADIRTYVIGFRVVAVARTQ
jgi:formylglycine-generating enzyme required for sulfatase activity